MNKDEFEELRRLIDEFEYSPSRESGAELKYFLKYCAKSIDLRKLKSKILKIK